MAVTGTDSEIDIGVASKVRETIVHDKLGKADHVAREILELLGDVRCPDGADMKDPDVIEQIIMGLNVLQQRLGFIRDLVEKL